MPPNANGVLSGTLDASGTALVAISPQSRVNLTATLKSSSASRKIDLSTDNAGEFFPADYDVNTSTMLVLAVNAPLSHVRFTGAAGDSWSVR